MSEREDLVEMAKVAEQIERYEEMASHMKKVAEDNSKPLSDEERNLLSVAFKNVVGTRRASWRILQTLIDRPKKSEQLDEEKIERQLKISTSFKEKVEGELIQICDDVINLLSNVLIPSSTESESKVFYYKMKGDYVRYKIEVMPETESKSLREESLIAYEEAYKIAGEKLHPSHPIRLGLALNFSVYYYEIEKNPEKACELAKHAFDEAIGELSAENDLDDKYKDSTLIMQLLRDNLTLWRSDEGQTED